MLPLIKTRSHDLFVKLAFPSMIEVIMTNENALSTFGLTSTSPVARMAFDKFVFKPQGSSSAHPISPENNSLLTPRHEYDTPNICDDSLWVYHGIGTFTIKKIGRTRNTITNICCDVVRMWLSCPSPLYLLYPFVSLLFQATFFWWQILALVSLRKW
jgi:hypothetical protein